MSHAVRKAFDKSQKFRRVWTYFGYFLFQNFAVFWMFYPFFFAIPRRLELYADVSEHPVPSS
jgi:hypothetical protein